jgi:glycosyltransferase involved in cell wall biosynthesis
VKAVSKKRSHKAESSELDQSSLGLSALDLKLNIGYDGKRAANNLTGLGNYSRSLIEQLSNQFPSNEYFVYTPKAKPNISRFPLFAKGNIHLKFPSKSGNKLFWRSVTIKNQLLADQIDLFHGLSHEIPFGIDRIGIKSIVTIHDLIFLRLPQYYTFIDRKIYKFKSKYACKHADRIIAISERTKQDIVDLYGTDPAKIDVVYQSCDDSFKSLKSPEEKELIQQRYQLPEKYLLYVGTVEARKNLVSLIRALPNVNIPLVVIGKATTYTDLVKQEIQKLKLQDQVIFLNSIPFHELPAIYQMASCFILPSFYEGFGIPIIEALYSKVPVIAATGSCLEEAGGPNSIYVAPTDSNALANSICRVLDSPQLQEEMKQKGLEYVQRFNNENVYQQLMECYRKTLQQ